MKAYVRWLSFLRNAKSISRLYFWMLSLKCVGEMFTAVVIHQPPSMQTIYRMVLWPLQSGFNGIVFLAFIIASIFLNHDEYVEDLEMADTFQNIDSYRSADELRELVLTDRPQDFRKILKHLGYLQYKRALDKYRINYLRYVLRIKPVEETRVLFLDYQYEKFYFATDNSRVAKRNRWVEQNKIDEEEIQYGIQTEWLILDHNNVVVAKVGFTNLAEVDIVNNIIYAVIQFDDTELMKKEQAKEFKQELLSVILFHLKEIANEEEFEAIRIECERFRDYEEIFLKSGYMIEGVYKEKGNGKEEDIEVKQLYYTYEYK